MEILTGKQFCDDRGFVSFINDLDLSKYKRFYLVQNHDKGFIRAWHGHMKESKAVICLKGAAKIGIAKMAPNEKPTFTVLSGSNPQAIVIPSGYTNGAMTLTDDCILMYLSDKTVEESHGDDHRLDWDHFGPECWDIVYR
jgi:dTDP-4-dehydrorhamnose 3,5-epimerase-like enzyme